MSESIDITSEYITTFLSKYAHIVDSKWVNMTELGKQIQLSVPPKMTMSEFYNYVADICVAKTSYHPDYNVLAAKICVDRLHNVTVESFSDVCEILYYNKDKQGVHHPLISLKLYKLVAKHKRRIQEAICMDRDYCFDYFGIRTLERSYLLKANVNGKRQIIERPQHLMMRVALGIHYNNITDAIETYNLMSERYFIHATPTLFNAGTNKPQMSSCFLLGIEDDMEIILEKWKEIGQISKWAGGIGVHLTAIRAKNSVIRGTNGLSDGIVPLCIVLNKIARYINQGGKRPGSIACYMEPFHADIFEFCALRKNTGSEDTRARDLFLALWIPDLFMKRVKEDGVWSLMCPDECPNLQTTHGEEFEKLYTHYEEKKMYRTQVPARKLWMHILDCQIETGFPYMMYKDHVNKKCNQKNLGTIRSSNLCAEITEYSDNDETAVCNLASVCLPRFVVEENGVKSFDYEKLASVCRVMIRNLNKIIDGNFYPTENAKHSNQKHRPVGLGTQGAHMVYNMMGYPFDSDNAERMNKLIYETIYYACVDESKELAKKYGKYKSFEGSPFSQGLLQFHLWGLSPRELSGRYDWDTLIKEVKAFGTRNSLLTALMPTAGTSQIMNCSECFEPIMSNAFVRTTMAGEFIMINESLVKTLIAEKLWNDDMRKLIIINNGSIQNIDGIPRHIKDIYKTAFELKLKSIIKQSIDRGPFVDQSQSMNLFMDVPSFTKLTSAHFYGWENGIKTGMYYLRSCAAVNPIQFGIDIDDIKRLTGNNDIVSLITDGYNITSSDKKEEEKPVKMCKFVPGKKAEGCLSCSG